MTTVDHGWVLVALADLSDASEALARSLKIERSTPLPERVALEDALKTGRLLAASFAVDDILANVKAIKAAASDLENQFAAWIDAVDPGGAVAEEIAAQNKSEKE